MSQTLANRPPNEPGPAWDIARLFPDQGQWDEWDYLALNTNHLVEFTDGSVEVLPMPKPAHQRIVLFLYTLLQSFVSSRKLGEVLATPMPVRLRKGIFREPDLALMLAAHAGRKHEDYWENPDLVVEVVSDDPESRKRDYEAKRRDYASAGISEYWIVDPHEQRITVLKLKGAAYAVDGEYAAGTHSRSPLLAGFELDVDAVFAAAAV